MHLTLKEILQAQQSISAVILNTPLEYSPVLSELTGAKVHMKLENTQFTGSFKIRGASHKIACLSEQERKKGIVTASAGNHALAVAYVAQKLGIDSKVVIPANGAQVKIEGTRRLGANVVLQGSSYDESEQAAHEIEAAEGRVYVHAFDDPQVIAGQGTIGVEIMMAQPDLDILLVPAGGGGLVCGIATAAKQFNPAIKVIAVQPQNSQPWLASFREKSYVKIETHASLADGLAGDISPNLVADFVRLVDDVLVVSEESIARAIFWYLDNHKTLVEGSGAVVIAALLDQQMDVAGYLCGQTGII
ncbi:MAG: threonine ammonia-lyase [Enterobacteriaceae bacterium]